MRTLTYFVATTIDGFIAGPGGGDPAGRSGIFPTEGDHVDAIVKQFPEVVPGHVRRAMGVDPENVRFDTVLEGRRSHEVSLRAGVANPYPHLRHIVFSRSLEQADPGVEVVADDPVETVRKLKDLDGDGLWLAGGARLAASLLPEIDALIVSLHPVTIGVGTPLFDAPYALNRFDLVSSTAYRSGVVTLRYTRRP